MPKSGRRVWRILPWVAVVTVLIVAVAAGWMVSRVRASLPALDGEVEVAGLGAAVTLDRDAQGVVTVRGGDRVDVARGLGFAHGQDRFFQMDLMRRQPAGELSALIGEAPVELDERLRVHRFRHRARAVLASLRPFERRLAEVYAEGVNAGLASLGEKPFEYLVLRAEPEPWRPEDLILVLYAMYLDLNDSRAVRESYRGLVHDVLGAEILDFIDPLGTEWDAPLVGQPFLTPAIPGPGVMDLRRAAPPSRESAELEVTAIERAPEPLAGSNNWAVAGPRSAHDGAMLANDMHLGHSVPNIWYRAALVFPDTGARAGKRRVTGVTLPGTPFVVAGSNGDVAWGFTNTWGDWADLVILEPGPPTADGEETYLTPNGPMPFERHTELIAIKGGDDRTVEVLETIWGPVIDRDHRDRRRALAWIAHARRGATLALLDVERATGVEQAMEAANRVGAPPQNFVCADSSGRIGWTIMGPIPRRFGHDGRLPSSWASGERGWDGFLEPQGYPRRVDPEEGLLWTANARTVDGEEMAKIGVGTYRLGARQRQIRDALRRLERPDEAALLAVQLDDRALFLGRWRELLLAALAPAAIDADPRRAEVKRLVENWGGRASVDSVGYRLVRAFRVFLAEEVFEALTAEVREVAPEFRWDLFHRWEGALWRMVSERPAHLLPPEFDSWNERLLAAVDVMLEHFERIDPDLSAHTWGRRNTVTVRHPLSAFIPGSGRWLDMPSRPLPGDSFMPRYQQPAEGASERFVVSPGREEDGIFHMPTGQSGHPLSPFYRAGHDAWATGEATPFLPGPPAHTLRLVPPGT